MKTLKRFFIVDDDPFWTALLVQMLNDLGYFNILTFNNGFDCLKRLDLEPGVIFLDYQMDDLNGIEVLKKIKQNHPQMNVLLCTANEDINPAVTAVKSGSFDFLLKANATKLQVGLLINGMVESKQE
jgi:DNA-binding NtrC family response regulator